MVWLPPASRLRSSAWCLAWAATLMRRLRASRPRSINGRSLLACTRLPATAASCWLTIRREPRRSAIAVAPGRDAAPEPFQHGGERHSEHHQHDYRHEHLVHLEHVGVARDHETEAGDGGVEFGDNNA